MNLLIFHDLSENLIKSGPEKQDVYSDKQDGFSPSQAFFLLLMICFVLNILLGKQRGCAPSESSL